MAGVYGSSDGSIVNGVRSKSERVILTDLSVLDCPICNESLISPVHKCINGHIACSTCCTKMANKCPDCRCPIGAYRCWALERIIESVKVYCRNKSYGCIETFKRNQKQNQLDHEKICCYNPCTCPYYDCNYIGIVESLFKHFGEAHSPFTFSFNAMKSVILDDNGTEVFLQDSGRSCLFVLKRTVNYPGSFVSVTCVGPDSMGRDFSYDLTSMIDWDKCVNIEASVSMIDQSVLGKCLVLHRGIVSSNEKLKLELIIRRNPTDVSRE